MGAFVIGRGSQVLRVVMEADGEMLHKAFFDRRFAP